MNKSLIILKKKLEKELINLLSIIYITYDEITIECENNNIHDILLVLRDNSNFCFNQLIDICGIDYLHYGKKIVNTKYNQKQGYYSNVNKRRYAVVYHLVSINNNYRVRVKVYINESNMIVPSACDIWPVSNWFEREIYDLYGVLFENHPDLRRILTDYGFIGYPFRKDFPLSGYTETRYDTTLNKVVYESTDIEKRILNKKIISNDNRYT